MMPWNRDSKDFDEISLDPLGPTDSSESTTRLAPNGNEGEGSSNRRYIDGSDSRNSRNSRNSHNSHNSPSPNRRPLSAIARENTRRLFGNEGGNSSGEIENTLSRPHRSYLRPDRPGSSHSRERSLNSLFARSPERSPRRNNSPGPSDERSKSLAQDDLEVIRANLHEAIGKNGIGSWLSGEDDVIDNGNTNALPYLQSQTSRSISPHHQDQTSDIRYHREYSRTSDISRTEEGLATPLPSTSGSNYLTVPNIDEPPPQNQRIPMPPRHVSDTSSYDSHARRKSSPSPSRGVIEGGDPVNNDIDELPRRKFSTVMRRISSRVISAAPDPEEDEDEEDSLYPPRHAHLLDSNSTLPVGSIRSSSPPVEEYDYRPTASFSDPLAPNITASTTEQLMLDQQQTIHPVEPRPITLPGRSLKIFGPTSKLRVKLYYLLKQPWVDPFIFILIILQTCFLAYETSGNIFEQRPNGDLFLPWGHSWLDIAYLIIFILYTIEICSRIIVQGLFNDAYQFKRAEDGTLLSRTFNNILLSPSKRVRRSPDIPDRPSPPYSTKRSQTIIKSFSNMVRSASLHQEPDPQDRTIILRAFLRTSWNRVDFISVSAYWLSFILQISGVEQKHSFFVFRAISSIRILRLLGLTQGTSAVLIGIKKSASLLGNVVIFIGFFW